MHRVFAFVGVCLLIIVVLSFELPQLTTFLSSFTQTESSIDSSATPLLTAKPSITFPNPSATPFPFSSSNVVSPIPSPTPFISESPTPTVSPTPTALPTPIPASSPMPSGFSHDDLVYYALALINSDRQSNRIANVSLSNINSAQNHADNMLQNNYLSYLDTNGYKPHMRYTLAGGLGAVSENIASAYTSGGTIDPLGAIKSLETLMMHSAQKTNIVYPFHNEVSIGIAFDNSSLYLVEDFENVHVLWSTLSQKNGNVSMAGTLDESTQSVQWIAVYYDTTSTLTPQQLANPPFYGAPYDMGTLIAAVLPSNGNNTLPGVIIHAQTWTQTAQNFQINFSLAQTFTTYGNGVYTLCLLSNLNETDTQHDSLSSYSIWYLG